MLRTFRRRVKQSVTCSCSLYYKNGRKRSIGRGLIFWNFALRDVKNVCKIDVCKI